MSCVNEIWEQAKTFEKKGSRRVSPHFVPRILGNMAAGHVTIKYGFRGPVYSPSTACATGASSIGEAFRAIKHGETDVMIAGSTESCIDPLSIAGFCQARALTTKYNDTPEMASRPFDHARKGFVIGEGAAVLILEEMQHAINRKASVVCEIVGYGSSADAYHITASHPEGLGAKLAMKRAMVEAGIGPYEVDYINAHATSTPLGDEVELKAISSLLPQTICVSSTKGATGHLLSAAGAVEGAFTALSVKDGIAPPTRNFDASELPESSNVHILKESLPKDIRYALSNSFGFGGMNVSLCFKSINE